MTPQERAAALTDLFAMSGEGLVAAGITGFADFHRRVQELVGRPVWTHEMALPELLKVEVLLGVQRDLVQEILDKIALVNPNAQVIVATSPEDALRKLEELR